MTRKQVANMISGIGVPYEYYQFPEGTDQATPFICFYYPRSDDFIADDSNYTKIDQLVIELYTDNKDFALEETVESVLKNNNLVYVRDSSYLDDERMYMTVYQTGVIIDG